MMDIGRSDEQIMIEEAVSRLIQEKFNSEILHAAKLGDNQQVDDLWDEMAAMGLCGLMLSSEFGGGNCGLSDAVTIMEQLGRAAAPSPLWSHYLASAAIALAGDAAQKEAWLPLLASGEAKATVAFCHSDIQKRTDAEIECNWVTFGKSADLCVIIDQVGAWGLLDMSKTAARVEPVDNCIDTSRQMTHLIAPRTVMQPMSIDIIDRIHQMGRVLLAAESWGAAEQLLNKTLEHVSVRRQFGRALAEFQAISQSLADMTVIVDFARPLAWHAAALYDHDEPKASETAALSKAHITENALKVARACIELHGASGFILEGDLHFWLNRIRFCSTHLGSPRQLRREIAALKGWSNG